jgi:hypothetical protein
LVLITWFFIVKVFDFTGILQNRDKLKNINKIFFI